MADDFLKKQAERVERLASDSDYVVDTIASMHELDANQHETVWVRSRYVQYVKLGGAFLKHKAVCSLPNPLPDNPRHRRLPKSRQEYSRIKNESFASG